MDLKLKLKLANVMTGLCYAVQDQHVPPAVEGGNRSTLLIRHRSGSMIRQLMPPLPVPVQMRAVSETCQKASHTTAPTSPPLRPIS